MHLSPDKGTEHVPTEQIAGMRQRAVDDFIFGVMTKLTTLLLCLGAFSGQAQIPATRPDSTIQVNILRNGRYTSAVYTVNHEPLTAATVKALLKRYPPAVEEVRKGRAQTRWALALLPVMAVALLVGKQETDQQKNMPGSAFSKAPVPVSILLGAFVGLGYLEFNNTHFAKAIEAYNRQFH